MDRPPPPRNSLGHGGRQGACAEYAVVPAARLYHLPAGADPVASAALFHPAATAWLALFRHGGLRPTETVAVGGGAGNVGVALTRLASLAGARVLATARPADAAWCRSAGAAEVVDSRDPDPAARLRALAPGGVDLYVDTSGHLDLPATVDLLADRGLIVLLAAGARPVRVHGVWPLERAGHAHRAVEGGVRGRIVLRVADPGW